MPIFIYCGLFAHRLRFSDAIAVWRCYVEQIWQRCCNFIVIFTLTQYRLGLNAYSYISNCFEF